MLANFVKVLVLILFQVFLEQMFKLLNQINKMFLYLVKNLSLHLMLEVLGIFFIHLEGK